ncbi:stromal cell-derived factor 1 isoform delta precursor [Camelus ferus]|nr:stromal cell-derived factor 1 isoform delta precursor [Camelus ferus]
MRRYPAKTTISVWWNIKQGRAFCEHGEETEATAAQTSDAVGPGKPVSLSYRCPCRFFESHVARANVKHLKILNAPNCALQIVARLKSTNRQVCIDPKLKWIQEYLEKALNNSPNIPM